MNNIQKQAFINLRNNIKTHLSETKKTMITVSKATVLNKNEREKLNIIQNEIGELLKMMNYIPKDETK